MPLEGWVYKGFNSMIVRLKDRMKIGMPLQYAGFNSMIVRLKG